jgi:hypothetical protein
MHISKLYIKYDKKLILNLQNIQIDGDKYSIDVKVDKFEDNLRLSISSIDFKSYGLNIQGDILTTISQLQEYKDGKKTDLVINDAKFIFDEKLSPIMAEKLFLDYKNDILSIHFEKPTYNGIKLDNSKVILKKVVDDYVLFLDLYSNSLIDKKVIELLKYYGVSVPIIQNSGQTNAIVKIKIPFNDEPMDIFSRIDIKNGNLNFEDITLKPKNVSVVVNNFDVKIISDETNITLFGEEYKALNIQSNIKNNKVFTSADIYDKDKNSITLYDVTDLNNLKSKGKVYINSYRNSDFVVIESEKLNYHLRYEPNIKVQLFGSADVKVKNHQLSLDNLQVDILDDMIDITANIEDMFQNKFTLYNKTDINNEISYGDIYIDNITYDDYLKIAQQKFQYSVMHKPFKINLESSIFAFIENNKVNFDNIKINFKENQLSLASKVTHKNQSITFNTITDMERNKSRGELIFHKVTYEDYIDIENESITFDFDFNDTLSLYIPEVGLNYSGENTKHTLLIKRPNRLLNKINNIKVSNDKSEIKIYTENNFKFTNLIVNNLDLDINSEFFNNKSKSDESVQYPTINLWAYNSRVKYDDFELALSTVEAKTIDNKLLVDFIPHGEKSAIKVSMVDKNYTITSKGTSDKFINKILKKRWFENGLFEFNLKGNSHKINGRVDMHQTNVKNMYLLNNLITFVNTTPAIINPILALPTLFRLGETNFDLDGYYVKHGYINFSHDIKRKYTTISDLYTGSKMTDFKAKGYVDILNEKLKFQVDVIFLKDFSKFLNHIPIVGYVFTGESGNFVTEVDVEGDFQEQSFETHTVKNASDGALGVIKRTLSIPLLPFMSDSNESNEEHEKRVNEILNIDQ